MTTTSTSRPRSRCRTCGCPATKSNPLVNGYDSTACAVSAILNRTAR